MAIYVGRWDCDRCGHIGNLGPHTHCSQCGSPRPDNVDFYLPRGIEALEDELEMETAKAGANWVCAFCKGSNHATYNACVSCGSLKIDSEKVLGTRIYTSDEVPTEGGKKKRPPEPIKKPRNSFKRWALGIVALLGAFFVLSTFSTTVYVPVTGLEWERSIVVEEFRMVEEEDWELPSEGKLLKKFKAIHHYDRRIVGYETKTRTVKVKVGEEDYICGKKDLGNGYFEDVYCTRPVYENREETYKEPIYKEFPVERTKYRYHIYRWKPYETFETSGEDKRVKWPKLPDFVETDAQKYRIANENEAYFFQIKDSKKHFRWFKTDFTFWDEEIFINQKLKARKSAIFGYFKGLELDVPVEEVSK